MKKTTRTAPITLCLLLLFIPTIAYAKHIHPEKWYQNKWCAKQKGQTEYRLPDKTRCDCLTDTHAIEVDFARKFYEAIGQALYYSMQTGKRAGVLLIIENKNELKYWIRLNSTVQHFGLPIDTWKVGA
ncbi:MAG: hypothetical protein GY710_26880 [Desulfobacteraceae bacterium]|nr:hypothetical protein [Desulfobacteraceae bacterium]